MMGTSNQLEDNTWSAVLLAVACTLAVFVGLPLIDYLCFKHHELPAQVDLKRIDIATPPPLPPPSQKTTPVRQDVPKPKLTQPRRLIPLQAALELNLDLGELGGDFAMNFKVNTPDLDDEDTDIFEISEIDLPPQSITRLSTSYPPKARMRRMEGYVQVEFVVGEDGMVSGAMVVDSNPPGVFDQAALRAIECWRFNPGRKHGNPIRVRVRQRIQFTLED